MTARRFPRRRVLAAVAGAGTLAGCLGGDDGRETADEETGEPATTAGPSTTAVDASPTADALDLREANVTAVDVEASGDGYRFSVTLYHDDDGEDGYADRWQVERPDGTELGRRELLHAHGTREFTRSMTVAVPEGAGCVVVRGHDETHGFGGQAMLVRPEAGATAPVRQGPEPRSFADADCP